MLYHNKGDYNQAEVFYRQLLAIRERILAPGHPAVAGSLERLAMVYRKTGRGETAAALEKRAAAIRASRSRSRRN
jgi:hypothetical protein